MTKTADALASLLQGLSNYSDLTNKLFDTEAGDRTTITQLTQERDQALAQVQTLTQQAANSVDDNDTAATISQAGDQLNAKLKQLSDKAATATPITTDTTPGQVAP